MSFVPFTRSLGSRSGVQLNYAKDESERFAASNADQVFAGVGRFTRGRIDRAFPVTRDKMLRLLGKPASATVNRLNEPMIQIYEAFQNGASGAVICRLTADDAALGWMVAQLPAEAGDPVWSVQAAEPTTGFLLAVQHLECFNEGINVRLHAVAAEDGNGDPVASQWVELTLTDLSDTELYRFEGSLDPLAVDEFGESTYLPNVVSGLTNDVEVVVASGASVPVAASFYGLDNEGADQVAAADLVYFTEGSTVYNSADLDRAVYALKNTEYPYGYLAGLGTQSTLVISKLAALGRLINKQCILDVPGTLSVAAAIAFVKQFNIDSHYVQWYWSPLKAIDPLNGGKDVFGVSGYQVGLRCQRNANTDANGIPPKNYPIAGKNWMLSRTSVVQLITPSDDELNALADAKINPVIYQSYNTASGYVFFDSLTAAQTTADRKLIAVAEMSSQIDDWVAATVKEYLQLPISDAIKRTTDFLQQLFEALETAKWLVPSESLENRSFVATVTANAQRPKDRVDVAYWLSYDGTTRAIYIQQTISK